MSRNEHPSLYQFVRFQVDMLRLRLTAKLLPPGYSLWTWGEDDTYDDLLDHPLVAKPLRKGESYV